MTSPMLRAESQGAATGAAKPPWCREFQPSCCKEAGDEDAVDAVLNGELRILWGDNEPKRLDGPDAA